MKYTIELMKNECFETLVLSNGSIYTKRTERTRSGGKEHDGFNEKITDVIEKAYKSFGA